MTNNLRKNITDLIKSEGPQSLAQLREKIGHGSYGSLRQTVHYLLQMGRLVKHGGYRGEYGVPE